MLTTNVYFLQASKLFAFINENHYIFIKQIELKCLSI